MLILSMEQQVEIKKQPRKRTKVAPEDREKHSKDYHKEYSKKYYHEKVKPFIEKKEKIDLPVKKNNLSPEEISKIEAEKKAKRKEYLRQYHLKIKQARLETEQKSESNELKL